MLHMPTPMLQGGGPSIPTYAQYQAAIAGLAANGVLGTSLSFPGTFRKTIATSSGDMIGSPWQGLCTRLDGGAPGVESSSLRALLHAMPSAAIYADQLANSREVIIRIEDGGLTGPFLALDRNGYRSSAEPGPINGARVPFVAYWANGAWKVDPFSGLGPVPWDMLSTNY